MLSRPYMPHPGRENNAISEILRLTDIEARRQQRTFKVTSDCPNSGNDDIEQEDIKKIIDLECKCGKSCLKQLKESKHNYETAICTILEAREEVLQKGFNNHAQQEDALRSKFNSTIIGQNTRRKEHNFTIRKGPNEVKEICRQAWARAHGVSMSKLDKLSQGESAGYF